MRDLAEAAQHVKALDRSFTSPKSLCFRGLGGSLEP